jgi:8-oxo-dGTP pyrophosphatase MutT (NUDIX family)
MLGRILGVLSWPAVYLVISRTARTKVLVRRGGTILVVKPWLSSRNRWTLPGGGIKSHELSLPAAIRELREETGLDLKTAQLKSLGMFRQSQGLRFPYEAFYVPLKYEPIIKRSEREIVQAAFVPLEQLNSHNTEQHVLAVVRAAQLASRG